MANLRSGDILQLSYAGRNFDVAGDSNVTYRLSGFTNESNPTGNGKTHTMKRRKLGGVDALPISVDPDRGDVEFLQEKSNDATPYPLSITMANGTVYSGDMVIEGDLDPNTGDGQVEVSFRGDNFEQI